MNRFKIITKQFIILTGCWLCCSFVAKQGVAQSVKSYFVYIQNEQGTPFYVKTNDSLMSSSPAGYIILPQLKEGKKEISIGFPKNEFPEEHFVLQLKSGHDQGYLLKSHGKKGFVLYNLRDFSLLQPAKKGTPSFAPPGLAASGVVPPPAAVDTPSTPKVTEPVEVTDPAKVNESVAVTEPTETKQEPDPFANMLNAVTGTKPAVTQAVAPDEGVSAGNDSNVVQESDQNLASSGAVEENDAKEGGEDSSLAQEDKKEMRKEARRRRRKAKNDEPQFITFTPSDSVVSVPKPDENNTVAVEEKAPSETKEKRRKRKLDLGDVGEVVLPPSPPPSAAANGIGRESTPQEEPLTANDTASNAGCPRIADEKEFEKLRRKMASQQSESGMLRTAKRYFGEACYSTVQLKSLVYLFTSDEYRYKFLDAAYSHTADADRFPGLGSVFTEEYYKGRFQAMVKK